MRVPTRRPNSGYSLIEVLIATSLTAVVLLSAAVVSRQGVGALQVTQSAADLEDRARRLSDRLSVELENTTAINPQPNAPFSVSDFTFIRVEGVAGNAPVLSDPTRIFWRYATGELDDGLDNNGDGLVDEGEIVMTRNFGTATEISVVLCRRVAEIQEGETADGIDENGNGLIDEPGFSVVMSGDVLEIRFTLQGRTVDGTTFERSVETGVRIRG